MTDPKPATWHTIQGYCDDCISLYDRKRKDNPQCDTCRVEMTRQGYEARKDASNALWDALSAILEDTDTELPDELRQAGLKAIEKAAKIFPEEA